MKYILLSAALCFGVINAVAETITFDMFIFGDKKVGTMTISHELRKDGTDLYIMESKSEAHILWINKKNYSRMEVVYRRDTLITAVTKEIENGELKTWSNIKWDGIRYNAENHKGKRTFTQIPKASIVTLFFKSPVNVKSVLHEGETDYNELKAPEPGTWEFNSSNGYKNVYHYVNGKIHHLEFHVSIATVKLVRTN